MSPYAGLDSPISLQSWNHQLKVDSASDKRIKQFADFLTAERQLLPRAGRQLREPRLHGTRWSPATPAPRGPAPPSPTTPSAGAGRGTRRRPQAEVAVTEPRTRRPRSAARRCSRSSRSGCCRSAAGWRSCWASAGDDASPAGGLGRRRVRPGHGPAPPAGRGDGQPGARPQHDPAVRRLAFDIASTQTNQVGRMQGWLTLWGLPPTGGDTDGLDGRRHGHHMAMGPDGLMPGMATEDELAQLRSLSGTGVRRRVPAADDPAPPGRPGDGRSTPQHAGEAASCACSPVDRRDPDRRDDDDGADARRRAAAPRCRPLSPPSGGRLQG